MARYALGLGAVLLVAGCAAERSGRVSLACDTIAPPTGFVLITGVSSVTAARPEISGFFLEERTACTHGTRHQVAVPRRPWAEIRRGEGGRRDLRVERSGFFATGPVSLADTLVFGAESPWPIVAYSITVEEAVASHVRDQRARDQGFGTAYR